MKLASKLIGVVFALFLIVLGLDAAFQVFRERSLFERDMRRDHAVLGRALCEVARTIARTDGAEQAALLVREASEPPVAVDLVKIDERALGSTFEERPSTPENSMLVTRVPVEDAASCPEGSCVLTGYAIELREPLAERDAYVARSIRVAALALAALSALAGLSLLGFGYAFIGRPVHLLVAQARRIGSGDFSHPIQLRSEDELGQLAREMNLMEDALESANQRVQAETNAKLVALEGLRHADRLATVGTLAAGVAHELGTPLNVVLARANLVARRTDIPEDARRAAAVIAEQVDRMTRIVRQLLGFARREKPRVVRTDLVHRGHHVVDLLEPMLKRANVEVVVEAERPREAWVDPGAMDQVLTNLLMNAVQATEPGGRVVIAVEPGPSEDQVALVVRDEGAGMDAHTQAHALDPFFTTKEVGSGTGLGLSVVHGIVEDHGGTVHIESTPGKGTLVRVVLPVRQPEGTYSAQ